MKTLIKCLSGALLALSLVGCSSQDEFISKGYQIDKSYSELKKQYLKEKDHKLHDDMVSLLENMMTVSENNAQLDWAIDRLFKTLASQDDYLTIVAYAEQLQTRGLSHQTGAYVMYEQAFAYQKLSMNKWSKIFGVKQVYRNYDFLRKAEKSYALLLKTYPHSTQAVQAKEHLREVRAELARHTAEVKEFNKKIAQQPSM